jgi:hypothetical protein
MAEEIGNSFDLRYDPHSQKWMLMPSDEVIARQVVLKPIEDYVDSEQEKFWALARGAELVKGTQLYNLAKHSNAQFDVLKKVIVAHIESMFTEIEGFKQELQEELRLRHQSSRGGVGHNRRVRVMIDAEALLEADD